MAPPSTSSVHQLVDSDGAFSTSALAGLAPLTAASAGEYAVVAVMGPQSSGKSTLLNALFGTTFEEMDALAGRSQTTRGIWVAAAASPAPGAPPPAPPLTLVLDLEGADGRERGEDDASFERQASLFALAVSDVLVINMWAKDVGREAGAGKPLLRTVFQVDLKLRAAAAGGQRRTPAPSTAPPQPAKKKTVLLFAFRDRTRTPLPTLAAAWEADLEVLWGGLAKPPALAGAALADLFDLRYTSLPNFEDAPDAFATEAEALRARFDAHSPDTLVGGVVAGLEADRLPGSALPLSLATMWEVVRSQRDLDLPAHKVMVSHLRCGEIGEAALAALTGSAAFGELAAAASKGPPLPGFGAAAAGLVSGALSSYDGEAAFFEAGAAADRRADLAAAACGALAPAHARQLEAAACAALDGARAALMAGSGGGAEDGGGGAGGGGPAHHQPFTSRAASAKASALAAFDAAASAAAWPADGGDPAVAAAAATAWPVAPARAGLAADVDALIAHLASAALADAEAAACAAARDALTRPAASLLDAAPPDVWPRLGRLFLAATGSAADTAAAAVDGYGHPPTAIAALRARIRTFGRGVVEARAREAAGAAVPRLKERWAEAFSRDEATGLPRSWAPGADVAGAAAGARAAAAGLLGALAAVRLPPTATGSEGEGGEGAVACSDGPDFVSRAVAALAAGPGAALPADASTTPDPAAAAFDLSVAAEWPPSLVPPDAVLLSPESVRAAWRAAEGAAERAVRQAVATVEARSAAGARGAPLWALLAIAVLGADELMAALRSPLWLACIVITLLFARTVYVELGVDEELSRGLLPGCIALAAKLGPTVRGVAGRTAEAVVGWVTATQAGGQVGYHPLGDGRPAGNGTATAARHGANDGDRHPASRPPPGGAVRQRRPLGLPAEVEMAGLQ